ncbi:cupin 2 [Meredithblackwellia eburnea MCA 4105]
MVSALPAPRRITVSNLPFPSGYSATSLHTQPEPQVKVTVELLTEVSELDGLASRITVGTHDKLPTCNSGPEVSRVQDPPSLVIPAGVNVRYNQLAPGAKVPMHRTTSTDYNIILSGSFHLITPSTPFAAMSSSPFPDQQGVTETICNPGDVVVQRGTLHSWENRGTEWARSIVVILGSEENVVQGPGGDGDGKLVLKDCFLG